MGMNYLDKLVKQAQQTYDRITRRLETAIAEQKKFAPRGRRTTAYAALEGRIDRLRKMQASAHERYERRQQSGGK
jgi:hypothetical protein